MTFEDLPRSWQEENAHCLSPVDREEAIVRVCRRAERVAGSVLRRDLIESCAAVLVVVLFGKAVLSLSSVVAKLGAAFLVLFALFVIYMLHRTRRKQRPASLNAPIREFCETELERLDRQIQLGRSVLWWYIAPGILGANAVYAGEVGIGSSSLIYLIATIIFGWCLYALNVRYVRKHLLPPRNDLASLLNQLQESQAE